MKTDEEEFNAFVKQISTESHNNDSEKNKSIESTEKENEEDISKEKKQIKKIDDTTIRDFCQRYSLGN